MDCSWMCHGPRNFVIYPKERLFASGQNIMSLAFGRKNPRKKSDNEAHWKQRVIRFVTRSQKMHDFSGKSEMPLKWSYVCYLFDPKKNGSHWPIPDLASFLHHQIWSYWNGLPISSYSPNHHFSGAFDVSSRDCSNSSNWRTIWKMDLDLPSLKLTYPLKMCCEPCKFGESEHHLLAKIAVSLRECHHL